MKLIRLTLYNFMPFKDEQTIEFPQHETQNVMLLFGDNMRGKTSFLNAIRWGFYGVAYGRHLREISRMALVNRDAADEGNWTMSVSLYFEHGGRDFHLSRKIERRETTIIAPGHDADFEETTGLKVDGMPVTGDRINHEINQIMPREVSRFFLFDGELLQEYENLLIEKSEQGRKIKESIESILGVPALVQARNELKVLLKDARKRQRSDVQKDKELQAYAKQQEHNEIELESIENDLEELISKRDELQEKIDELDDVLKNTEAVQKKQIDLTRLEERQKSMEREIELANIDTHGLLKSAWQDMLAKSAQNIVVGLKDEQSKHEQARRRAITLQGEINELQKSLKNNKVCTICGQDIPDDNILLLKEKLEQLLAKQKDEAFDFSILMQLGQRIENLERIRSEGEGKRIIDNQRKIIGKKVELVKLENDREDIEEEIKDFDTDEIMRRRDERDQLLKLLAKIEEEIKGKEAKKEQNNQLQQKISQLITKSSGVQSSISNLRVDRMQQLETIFTDGIEQLRTRLRGNVEANATKTFKRITTEETYSGLQINQNYGLSILDGEQRIINERSAGAEQVVALSLIDGLNKTSGTRAPVIMDTPLGRLDLKHRKNILHYLPDMSEQVVLLVHQGELDITRDTEVFAGRIGARYEIKRVSATQSRIDRMA